MRAYRMKRYQSLAAFTGLALLCEYPLHSWWGATFCTCFAIGDVWLICRG